mgnify:CR=1 FL=1
MITARQQFAKIDSGPAAAGPLVELPPAAPLSPSQVNKYLACPAAWYFRYELRLPDPPTGALALGSAVHDALALALKARIAGHSVALDEVLHAFALALVHHLAAAELRADEDAGQLALDGRALLQLYYGQVLHTLQPAHVELPITGEIAGVPVRAIVDLIDTAGQVFDLKTAAKRPAGITPRHALQLTTYAMLTGARTCHLHTLVRTKTPQFVPLTLDVTPEDRRYAETMYPLVADAIATRIYPPRRDNNLCSRRHCAFWRACQAEYGGVVPE